MRPVPLPAPSPPPPTPSPTPPSAAPGPGGRALPAHLAFLRERLRPPPPRGGVLAFGDARIDSHLPGGGLALGAVHEIGAAGRGAETGELPAAFAAVLAARIAPAKPVLWLAPVADLYPPGLPWLDPGRLILASPRDDAGVLAGMEVALRAGGFAAVVGELAGWGAAGPRVASRRLGWAAASGGVSGFVLRRFPYGGAAAEREATAVATRWGLASAPSGLRGAGRWRVELRHARAGRPGAWVMEVSDDPTHPVRVVAALADHAAAPPAAFRQAAGHG